MAERNTQYYSYRSQIRTIVGAGCVTLLLIMIAEGRTGLEYYFRFSKEYHWIYANGSFMGLLLQLFLLIISLVFSLYLIYTAKRYSNRVLWIGSFVLAASPFTYFTIALMYTMK